MVSVNLQTLADISVVKRQELKLKKVQHQVFVTGFTNERTTLSLIETKKHLPIFSEVDVKAKQKEQASWKVLYNYNQWISHDLTTNKEAILKWLLTSSTSLMVIYNISLNLTRRYIEIKSSALPKSTPGFTRVPPGVHWGKVKKPGDVGQMRART